MAIYWKVKCPKCEKISTCRADSLPDKFNCKIICDCGHKFTPRLNIVEIEHKE